MYLVVHTTDRAVYGRAGEAVPWGSVPCGPFHEMFHAIFSSIAVDKRTTRVMILDTYSQKEKLQIAQLLLYRVGVRAVQFLPVAPMAVILSNCSYGLVVEHADSVKVSAVFDYRIICECEAWHTDVDSVIDKVVASLDVDNRLVTDNVILNGADSKYPQRNLALGAWQGASIYCATSLNARSKSVRKQQEITKDNFRDLQFPEPLCRRVYLS